MLKFASLLCTSWLSEWLVSRLNHSKQQGSKWFFMKGELAKNQVPRVGLSLRCGPCIKDRYRDSMIKQSNQTGIVVWLSKLLLLPLYRARKCNENMHLHLRCTWR